MQRQVLGQEAEELAARFLERQGYRIRDRNYACPPHGELDIVAEHGEVLCFVEVRMRSTDRNGAPLLTVMSSKQHRVVKASMHYLQRHRLWGKCAVRFDVVAVTGRGEAAQVEHIPNAFDAGM